MYRQNSIHFLIFQYSFMVHLGLYSSYLVLYLSWIFLSIEFNTSIMDTLFGFLSKLVVYQLWLSHCCALLIMICSDISQFSYLFSEHVYRISLGYTQILFIHCINFSWLYTFKEVGGVLYSFSSCFGRSNSFGFLIISNSTSIVLCDVNDISVNDISLVGCMLQ